MNGRLAMLKAHRPFLVFSFCTTCHGKKEELLHATVLYFIFCFLAFLPPLMMNNILYFILYSYIYI